MLTDLVIKSIDLLLSIYTNYLHTPIANLLTQINEWQNYRTDFVGWLGGVYYILGKPLCIFMLTTFGIILTIRVIFAIVNIVGQYVP